MKMFEKEQQKQLKAQYKELLKTVWDSRMVDYCSKKADVVIKFDNGFYAEIEKPSIETSFCFGYSLSRYDTEDYDRANKMAHYASESQKYFRNENLKPLQESIAFYSDKNNELYFINHYIDQKNDVMKSIQSFRQWETPTEDKYVKLTDKDRKILVEAYKVELERFTKRVDSYLKRYGTSKVRSWSYWQDE